MRRLITAAVAATALAFTLSACEETTNASESEDSSRQKTYGNLVKAQPAETMGYSPTRETKNQWVRTWGEEGKLSYVYLLNANGDSIGYYVLTGLPVSYCTSLVPPVKGQSFSSGNWGALVPQPSVDGTYSSGANCNAFYGFDATTGMYIEYTTGQGINALVYDQPMPRFETAQPLGQTTADDVE